MVSTVKLGSGSFTYEVAVDWEKLPSGYSWRDAAGVAVDSMDRVYVFNRGSGERPVIVFDRDGNFLDSWGDGIFTNPHAITLAPDDTLYLTDAGDHTVRQFTLDGKLLMTIGVPGEAAPLHGGKPFNKCTHVALHPKTGELFISDGYGNSSVHKYSPDGKLLLSWGAPGTDPGEFNIPHNIATDKDGYVYVADRENYRVQIFDSNGKFETQWVNLHRPCTLFISEDQHVYIGELGWGNNVSRDVPNIGPRISVYNTNGKRVARIGHLEYGLETGQFLMPHGLCLNSRGDVYMGEVAHSHMINLGKPPDGVRSFQKLARVESEREE